MSEQKETRPDDHAAAVDDATEQIAAMFKVAFDHTGYACPVVLECENFYGRYAYFRARGEVWAFEVSQDRAAADREDMFWTRYYSVPDPARDAILAMPDSDAKWAKLADHMRASLERPGAFPFSWLSGDALYAVLAECIVAYRKETNQ